MIRGFWRLVVASVAGPHQFQTWAALQALPLRSHRCRCRLLSDPGSYPTNLVAWEEFEDFYKHRSLEKRRKKENGKIREVEKESKRKWFEEYV